MFILCFFFVIPTLSNWSFTRQTTLHGYFLKFKNVFHNRKRFQPKTKYDCDIYNILIVTRRLKWLITMAASLPLSHSFKSNVAVTLMNFDYLFGCCNFIIMLVFLIIFIHILFDKKHLLFNNNVVQFKHVF